MAIDDKDVHDIAHLARIKIDESDIPQYTEQLSNILNLVDKMQIINKGTDTPITPLSNPLDATQRLRPDVISEADQRDDFQSVAPQTESGLYLVPKVIE